MKSDPSSILRQRCPIAVDVYHVNHTVYTANFMYLVWLLCETNRSSKERGSYRIFDWLKKKYWSQTSAFLVKKWIQYFCCMSKDVSFCLKKVTVFRQTISLGKCFISSWPQLYVFPVSWSIWITIWTFIK